MPRYLINEREAAALRKLVDTDKLSESLGFDNKRARPSSNYPFRFKLLEAMGATTANKANAAIYYYGDSTAHIYDTDMVVDDSSQYNSNTSGSKGVCIAAEEYYIVEMLKKKPSCRFTANAAFTISSVSVLGTIVSTDLYGEGIIHSISTAATFRNMKTHSSLYEFYGDVSDAGLADYSGTSNIWYIKMFECP